MMLFYWGAFSEAERWLVVWSDGYLILGMSVALLISSQECWACLKLRYHGRLYFGRDEVHTRSFEFSMGAVTPCPKWQY